MAKVLLVEDDNNLREIYSARLQAEGYTIVSAKDGEEALVVAKAEKPDLVISDVMMPKISGFEMLDILRNTDGLKEVKVIMLTALGQSDDQQRADKLGADRYLVKSQVTLEDIVKTAHDLLEGSSTPETAPTDPAPTDVAPAPDAQNVQSDAVLVEPAPAPEPLAQPPNPNPPATPPSEPPKVDAGDALVAPTSAAPADSANQANNAAGLVVEETPASTAAAPETTASSQPDTSSGTAVSTAQEEAAVEAKIEDFVAGASSEATPPPTATPEASDTAPVAEPTETSEPVQPTTEVQAQDDKLIDDAVTSLAEGVEPAKTEIASAPAESTATAPTPADLEAPSGAPTTVAPTEQASPEPAKTVEPETDNDHVKIAHKKVIEPIDSSPKKDLDTLMKLEEAKEASAAAPPPPTAVIATDKEGPKPTPLSTDGETPDPHDIAL
jgi:CheY-like chemotaxis protein